MNSHRLIPAILATVAAFAAPSVLAFFGTTSLVPSGKVISESRVATGYTGVVLAVPGTLVIRQGPAESVMIEADDNLMPEIESVVERGSLRIRFRHKHGLTGRASIRILVTGPTFESLAVAGGGDLISEGIKAPTLFLSVAGAGDVRIARLEVNTLKTAIAGSGDIRIAGRATDLSAKIAGSGDIDAGKLESQHAKVSIAGSGDVTVWARETLNVTISGSGDVRYRGDPSVTKKVAGAGSLRRLDPAP